MTDTPTLIARLRRDHWIQRDTSGAIVTAFIERDCAEAADALEALACDNASLVETARKNNDTIEHLLAERDELQRRLSAENESWSGRVVAIGDKLMAAYAERDRLREALELVATTTPTDYVSSILVARARAALSGEGGEK